MSGRMSICGRYHETSSNAADLIGRLVLAVGLQLIEEVIPRQRWMRRTIPDADERRPEMDGNYVFLCGVMWCRFGQQDAGKELLRAADSGDPDMKALAGAMFAKGLRRWRELEGRMRSSSRMSLGEELCG
jgi:hypothetical protein